uniref:Uncharacterized protein n=1 Tax=viral metagenome TaxID=1070528 RepID=A0A6C0H0S6_9ZZZZ
MEDYKKKYLKYKKKYMMLKLGGSKNRTVTKDQLTQPQFTEAQKDQRRLTLYKLLRENNVEDFLKNNKELNDLLINNKNKLKKQLDPKNIYKVVTGNEKKQFWERLPHSLRQYFKNYRQENFKNYREENSKNIENFIIYTKSIDNIRYLINEFYIFNDIILCELKKISLTNLENFLKENKLNENKRNKINNKIKEISNFEISNCDINNTDKKSAKVLVEEPQKNTKSEESQKKKNPWIKAAEKSDKLLEKNTKSDDFFGIKVDTNIIHTHIEPYDNCNPYFMNDNMSLYTNDYLEKYLIRTKIKIDYYIIQPSDVLLSTLIPKNASLISNNKNEYEYLDLGFKIIIIYKDEEKGKWNNIEDKAQKWIQSLRQIDEVKNHNGFIDYIIENKNKVITYVRELLLLNIYNYINGNKNESLNKKICSICSLYNDKNEINGCLMPIPNNHYTFNKDVFCVLLKTNEFTGKLELPEKINEDNNNNEYNVEGTYYFITKSNYTNNNEYILSINDFDEEFRKALLKHCERQDEIQNNCFKLKKNIEKKIEKKISLNINVDKHKETNNKLDKYINYSKRLSIRIGSISSIIYVGKFITKNLLLTSCSCPFIINNVDATVKMLQDINHEYKNSYADPELKFRESIIQIPNNQKKISNPINLEKEYIQYAVNHKNRKISLFDTQWEKKEQLRQERQTYEYNKRHRKINPQIIADQITYKQKTSNVIEKYQLKFDKEYLNECKLDLSTEKNSQFIFTLVRTDKNSDNTCKDILEFYVLTKPLGFYKYIATGSNQYKTLIYDRHNDLLKKINLNELNSKINKITNINDTKNKKDKKDIFIAFTYVGENIITYLITFEEFMEMINKKFIEFGKKVNDSYDNIKKKYDANQFSLTEQENNLILIDSVYTDIKKMLLNIDNNNVNVFDNDTIEYLVKIPNIGSQIIPPKKETGLQNNKIVTEDLINENDDLDYGSIKQSDIEQSDIEQSDIEQSDIEENNKSKDYKQKNKSKNKKQKNNKFGRENYY